jgi:hypothetical protein
MARPFHIKNSKEKIQFVFGGFWLGDGKIKGRLCMVFQLLK